jgi:hypothetical protein
MGHARDRRPEGLLEGQVGPVVGVQPRPQIRQPAGRCGEDRIAQAVQAFPQASAIYETNIQTLRRLGHAGWRAWMDDAGGEGAR